MFSSDDLGNLIEDRTKSLVREVSALSPKYVRTHDHDIIASEIVARHIPRVPELLMKSSTTIRNTTNIPLPEEDYKFISQFGQPPTSMTCLHIAHRIRFRGDWQFFTSKPPLASGDPPIGFLKGNYAGCVFEILEKDRVYRRYGLHHDYAIQRIDQEIEAIGGYVSWINAVQDFLSWHREGLYIIHKTMNNTAKRSLLAQTIGVSPSRWVDGNITPLINRLISRISGVVSMQPKSLSRPPVVREFDFFMSYARGDYTIVKQLVDALIVKGARVWWDDIQIKIGNRLTVKLDEGFRKSKHGLIIVSPRFVERNWTQAELRAFENRLINGDENVLLPVLLEMSHLEFAQHFPLLADVVSTTFKGDIEALAKELMDTLR